MTQPAKVKNAPAAFSGNVLFGNILSLLFSNIGTTVLAFILGWVMARQLGDTLYGVYATILGYATILTSFTGLGLERLLTREVAKDRQSLERLATAALWSRLLASGLLVGLVLLLGLGTRVTAQYPLIYALLLAVTLIQMMTMDFVAIFRGVQQMRREMRVILLERGLALVLVIAVVLLAPTLEGMVAALLVAALVGLAYALGNFRLLGKLRPFPIDRQIVRLIIVSGIPLGINGILTSVFLRMDVIMLGERLPSEHVAWFSIAYTLITAAWSLGYAVSTSLFPIFSKLTSAEDDVQMALLNDALRYITLSAIGMAFGLFVIAEPLVLFVYGEEFRPAGIALKILALSLICLLPINILTARQTAHNMILHLIIRMLFAIGLLYAINITFIPSLGYAAAALSNLIVGFFWYGADLYALRRRIVYLDVWLQVRTVLAGVITFAILVAMPTVGGVLLAALTLPLALLALRVVTLDDWTRLRTMIQQRTGVGPS